VLGRTEDFSVTITKKIQEWRERRRRRKKRRSKRIQRYQGNVTCMMIM
jgi:hypothetical protein